MPENEHLMRALENVALAGIYSRMPGDHIDKLMRSLCEISGCLPEKTEPLPPEPGCGEGVPAQSPLRGTIGETVADEALIRENWPSKIRPADDLLTAKLGKAGPTQADNAKVAWLPRGWMGISEEQLEELLARPSASELGAVRVAMKDKTNQMLGYSTGPVFTVAQREAVWGLIHEIEALLKGAVR